MITNSRTPEETATISEPLGATHWCGALLTPIVWSIPRTLALVMLALTPDAHAQNLSAVPSKRSSLPFASTNMVGEYDVWGSVSPDGDAMTFVDWSTGNLAVRNLQTQQVRHLTSKGSWIESDEFALVSKFSPDGKEIAYSWFNQDGLWELRTVGRNASKPRTVLVDSHIRYVEPHAWSPDGKKVLASLRANDNTWRIISISLADGSMCTLKKLNLRGPRSMCFLRDGNRIVYDLAAENSPNHDIHVRLINEDRDLYLVKHPANDVLLGCFPDGDRILFASDRTGKWGAWMMSVSKRRPFAVPALVNADIGAITRSLGFTRDGAFYYGRHSSTTDVYLANFDSEEGVVQPATKMVNHVGFNTTPRWSPDGKRLAYILQRGASPWDLFSLVLGIRSTDSGKVSEIPLKMTRFGGHTVHLGWAPDGHSLLAQGRSYVGNEGFYRIDLKTAEVRPVVESGQCPNNCLEWPAWSADGKVYFTRWISKGRVIVVRDLVTERETELYRSVAPFIVSQLAISPDSQWLAFVRQDFAKGTTALAVMPADGGELREWHAVPRQQMLSLPEWTPDSLHIIFALSTRGKQREFSLWQISANGNDPKNLRLTMKGLVPYGISIRPDGNQIALTAGTPNRSEVWVLNNFPVPPITQK